MVSYDSVRPMSETENEDHANDNSTDVNPINEGGDRSRCLAMPMQYLGILEITLKPDRKEITDYGNGSHNHIDEDIERHPQDHNPRYPGFCC
jgi:hypothetical protein